MKKGEGLPVVEATEKAVKKKKKKQPNPLSCKKKKKKQPPPGKQQKSKSVGVQDKTIEKKKRNRVYIPAHVKEALKLGKTI